MADERFDEVLTFRNRRNEIAFTLDSVERRVIIPPGYRLEGGAVARVELSPADILAIHTTSVPIIPAAGPGRVIQIQGWVAKLKVGAAGYLLGSDIKGYCGEPSNDITYDNAAPMALVRATEDSVVSNIVTSQDVILGAAHLFDNQPIVLKASGDAFTTGDGTLIILANYFVFVL